MDKSLTMKLLVAIANYGTQNDQYLQRVLAEYRSMPFKIDIVVLSNIPKDLGPDVKVRVGLPTKDPWSLPFGHKQLFADSVNDYDLFIYSEDDMLVSARNIMAFQLANQVLEENEIAGFLRTETDRGNKKYFCDVFDNWHWDPDSVRRRGNETFAFFSNEHSAFYLLTRAQLLKSINSGAFLAGPRQGKHDLLCTAATDPYTVCGLKKLICVSRLDDFLIAHLSNKYVNTTSLEEVEFRRQIQALLAIGTNGRARGQLFETETRLPASRWSKRYYEPFRRELLEVMPQKTRSVLSLGCGWGAAESCLAQNGMRVVGLPLDSVISSCAEARGVEVFHGSFEQASEALAGQDFDCLLISNVLHLVENPTNLLSSFLGTLKDTSKIIAVVPNLSKLPVIWGRLQHDSRYKQLGNFKEAGIHVTSKRTLKGWFRNAGIRIERIIPVKSAEVSKKSRFTMGMADSLLASEFIVVGTKG